MKKSIVGSTLSASAVFMVLASVYAAPTPITRFVVTDVQLVVLGTLGGAESVARDININGTIVGWAHEVNGTQSATKFLNDGTPILIVSFLGQPPSTATGINIHGSIVGFAFTGARNYSFVQWATGGMETFYDNTSTGPIVPGFEARAISDSGLVAGIRTDGDVVTFDYDQAVMWGDPNNHTVIEENYPWHSWANDVNSSWMVVGYSKNDESQYRWRVTNTVNRTRIPLPTNTAEIHYYAKEPLGINNAGAVVGVAGVYQPGEDSERAFFWNGTSTTAIDLGVLPGGVSSSADDINSEGFIVGRANTLTTYKSLSLEQNYGFIYHPDFGLYQLPRVFPWNLGDCTAVALNERKVTTGLIQVAGTCGTTTGRRAVRWDVTVVRRAARPPFPPF